MMSDLPVWSQLVVALVVAAAMGVGTAFAGMCGGLLFGLIALVVVQVILAALRQARASLDEPADDQPPPP